MGHLLHRSLDVDQLGLEPNNDAEARVVIARLGAKLGDVLFGLRQALGVLAELEDQPAHGKAASRGRADGAQDLRTRHRRPAATA